jgi:hypothetical protein
LTAALAAGSHSITAVYGGDANFATSTSAILTQTVNNPTKPATTTVLASSLNPSTAGQAVTFTATVTSTTAGTLTGTVAFFDGATNIGSGTLSAGHATFSTSALSAGAHSITAAYQGDATFAASTSTVLTQTVNNPAKAVSITSVASSLNPSAAGQLVTFTATVTSTTAGTLTGSVAFLDGATNIGTSALSAGHATFSTSALSNGAHSITAAYQGDATFAASSSTVVTETVNAVDFTIGAAAGGSTSLTVKAGQPANYSLQLALPAGSLGQVSVTVSCTGAPAKATCSGPAVPVTVTGATPSIVTISVSTTANASLLPLTSSWPRSPINFMPVLTTLASMALLFWLATTKRSPLSSGVMGRRMAYAAPMLVLFVALTFLSGCGGGGTASTPGPTPTPVVNNGTPVGTYNLTVTAVGGGATHVQQLTLTVQ